MQIAPLSPGSLNPTVTHVGATPSNAAGHAAGLKDAGAVSQVDAVSTLTPSGATDSTQAASASPLRNNAALPTRDTRLNTHIANGQQTSAYLDKLAKQLEALKVDVSNQIAIPSQINQSKMDDRLRGLHALWQQRQTATQGSLSAQLDFQPDGQAQQTFKVRGLDKRSLQQREGETLSFTTGASTPADRRILTAVIQPDQAATTQARVLDQTLTAGGVRLQLDPQGDVTLTTSEANWPSVREGFSVRGGGIRFPAKQFHRIKAEAEPDAIRPDTWQTQDTTALRQTLQQVVPALSRVRQARDTVQKHLDASAGQLDAQAPQVGSGWANDFARSFSAVGQQPAYAVFATIAPALQGISRPRVEALLTLDPSRQS